MLCIPTIQFGEFDHVQSSIWSHVDPPVVFNQPEGLDAEY